jgi:putative transposase
MHRRKEGDVKTCTLRKNTSGNSIVFFSCQINANPKTLNEECTGIDVGLEHFATLSNGEQIANPRFFKRKENALAKAQRKLAKLKKETPERRKQGKVVAKIHERIGNQRRDFCHKESKKIIDQFQYICVEDLNIKNMMEASYFAKRVTDVSWNQFLQFLTCKAAEAGRKMGLVSPAYTTQDRYQCRHREEKKLSERTHCCSCCGYTVSRDFNAAQNILALGLNGLGVIPRSPRL